ncbi:MAG: RNA chaperone Hfq [Acidobacteriota bacterium]|nr:RNA chaperone Hfq [Acidobacteriota bacterium]
MKEDTAARRAPEAAATAAAPASASQASPVSTPTDDFSNRKLIRPTLTRPELSERRERPAAGGRKLVPPEQTHAENFYYQKQMQTHTQLVVVLKDGEQIRGTIEWYDRDCIKITRSGQSNILLYKPSIKYIYKDESGNGTGNKR